MRSSGRPAVCCLLLVLLAGCAGAEQAETPAVEPEPAVEAVSIDPAVLDHPSRSEDDHYRDGGFKPIEVYGFFGVEPGMTVGDFLPSRGYNTVLLSQIVGPEGKVVAILRPYATNEESVARSRGFLEETLTNAMLDNVEMVDDLAATPEGSLDLLLTVRNYHDLGEQPERVAALPDLMRTLKPGGVFAVIDAYTDRPDERDESVHRINDELARSEITGAGFEFLGASDLLMNADDTFAFDGREREGRRGATEDAPIHRYYIHRWVHKYRKPLD